MLSTGKGRILLNGFWILLILFIFSPLIKNIFTKKAGNVSRIEILMDTFVRVDIYDSDKSRDYVNARIDSVFSIFREIESYFDR